MTRYKLIIEYDGTPFCGWQAQDNGASVQSALEDAVFAFCGERVRVHGAGRTDAGVHALGQVAHLDVEKPTDDSTLRDAINFHLGARPISIIGAEKVAPTFQARFSATARHYRYLIINRRARLALDADRAWQISRPLNIEAMQESAEFLIGKHDFTTFRSSHCQAKSPLKTLDTLEVHADEDRIVIETRARSFLHNQVRSMVGSLMLVGEGKWRPQMMKTALESRNRAACGPVAPAHGLYLVRVEYAPDTPSDEDDEA